MLTYRRPSGSRSELRFINRFIRPLGVCEDEFGNLIKRIGTAPVLWSSHTDSVHRQGGKRQTIMEDKRGIITAHKSSCLGADNAAGVWIMCEMIRAGRPGLYIFHREEEWGCRGSEHIARMTPELLDGINYAIAFDRRGTTSIITHQMGERSCSDSFARALGAELGMKHRLDSGGSYTDTASYMSIIPECTNISAGFSNEHRSNESCDTRYLDRLLEAVLHLDVGKLPVARTPGTFEAEWDRVYDNVDQTPTSYGGRAEYGYGLSNYEKLRDIVRHHPDLVVDYLEGMGVGVDDLLNSSDSLNTSYFMRQIA